MIESSWKIIAYGEIDRCFQVLFVYLSTHYLFSTNITTLFIDFEDLLRKCR